MSQRQTLKATDRTCSTCGTTVEHLPYMLYLFHTCRACAAETQTRKWSHGYGTERKWRYFPRWHMTEKTEVQESE